MIQDWEDVAETNHRGLPRRIAFISDLHLFSSRSTARQRHRQIEAAVAWSDLCIWGGDLFDFRWNRVHDDNHAQRAAIEWLGHWYDAYSDKRFVFLRGNHDADRPFGEAIESWGASRSRFYSDLDAIRFGETLFVHGDVIERGGTAAAFANYRQKWQEKPVAGRFHNHVYDTAIRFRLHKTAATMAHRNRRTCRRLIRWLGRQPFERRRGLTRIVFGHTHRFIDGLQIGGFTFYNGGAAIRHVKFSPVLIEAAS